MEMCNRRNDCSIYGVRCVLIDDVGLPREQPREVDLLSTYTKQHTLPEYKDMVRSTGEFKFRYLMHLHRSNRLERHLQIFEERIGAHRCQSLRDFIDSATTTLCFELYQLFSAMWDIGNNCEKNQRYGDVYTSVFDGVYKNFFYYLRGLYFEQRRQLVIDRMYVRHILIHSLSTEQLLALLKSRQHINKHAQRNNNSAFTLYRQTLEDITERELYLCSRDRLAQLYHLIDEF